MIATRMRGPLRTAVLAGSVLSLAACGSSGYSGPTSWPAQSASGVFSAGATADGTVKRLVADAPPWQLTRSDPADPNVDPSTWPDARTAFTDQQLKAVFPDATTIDVPVCDKLSLPGGAKSPRDTQCNWTITFPGSDSPSGSLQVILRGFGADSALTTAWLKKQAQQIEGRFTGDTFYAPGTYGAKGTYFLSNSSSSVLTSDGKVAAWVDIDFVNFTQALGNDADKATQTLRSDIFPVLVKDLVERLPRSSEGTAITGSTAAS